MRVLPSDILEPPLPYVKGWRFSVRSHVPVPPVSTDPRSHLEDADGSRERSQLDPVERCLRHPPTSGAVSSSGAELEIHDTLRVGDGHNAQLVVVDVVKTNTNSPSKGLAEGKRVVAKIYDPLYVFDDDGYLNPFQCVESYYTNESATYTELLDLQGTWIPKYYGSYVLEIPTQGASTPRCVRFILMELIPGASMRDTDPNILSRRDRQRIMKRLVDFDTILYTRDIVYADKHPRNVILTTAWPRGEKYRRVVFIEFGSVRFRRSGYYPPRPEHEAQLFPGTYISPLLRWHERRSGTATHLSEFGDWIDWDWQPWLEAEYAHTASSISEEMQDTFLPSYLFNLPEPPPMD